MMKAGIFFIVIALTCVACEPPDPDIRTGALYTVDDGEGWYRVAKTLVVDNEAVHIRLYKDRWKDRPTSVDVDTLSLGTVNDSDGFGMGHLPLSRNAFAAWNPEFLADSTVVEEELEGYRVWQEEGGGLF
ncbi:MAG: hypothetical protein ACYTBS_22165 [Planctomycetota bacterium]|jgi:hypothetical protein